MDQGLKYLTLDNYAKAEREFQKVLELQARNEIALYNLACTYSRWGKLDEAIEMLRRSIEAGFDDVSHMDKDPDLDPIRDDPRTKQLLDAIRQRKGAGGDER
jgi:pentatricopeptide repeat protein